MNDINEELFNALQDALDLKQRELDLILAIDEIRDSISEPDAMLGSIVKLLANQLEADLCMLFLLDRKSGEAKLKAVCDRDQRLDQLQQVITGELAESATRLDNGTIWEGHEVLSEESLIAVPERLHMLAVPVIMGTNERLGAMLLARTQDPFGPGDLHLLETAEDQIDSAVIQGYLFEQRQLSEKEMKLRQEELSLVRAIDEIRDSLPEPAAMLESIINLVANRLQADLCLLFLVDRESGETELKVVNERDRKLGQLQQILTPELAQKATRLSQTTIWEEYNTLPAQSMATSPRSLHLVAVPIIMGTEERLGALLIARSQPPFNPDDVCLLEAAEDQIDSAVIQGYAYEQRKQSEKEVEIIYQVDRIRDQGLPLDEMLNAVINILSDTIEAEMGFVMLFDRAGKQLEMRAATHQDLFRMLPHYEVINQTVDEALQQARLVCHNHLDGTLHSVMCLPLILNAQIIGVLGVVNRYGAHGFTAADRRLLSAIGSQLDTAIYERREIRRLREVLGRSVDPHVMERLLANPDVDILKPERLKVTVLYADIRGSTSLAEQTEPEQLVGFIKDYLSQMTEVILAHEGTVDKFVGDEVMALFGAPFSQDDQALRAVRAGLAMQAAHQKVMKKWQKRGIKAPPIGIGIATGELIVGEMGSTQRANYTVIGRDANLGARICSTAKGGQVLISQATYDELTRGKEIVEATCIPKQHFKGIGYVDVFQITQVLGG